MPRVAIKKKDYKLVDFRKWLVGEMAVQGIKQSELASLYGITQQSVSHKIKTGNFTFKELLILFEKLGTTEEEIGKLLKV